jgi:hypothetical protein
LTYLPRKLSNVRLEVVGYWLMLFLTVLGLCLPPFRHFSYLVPFVALLIGLADGRFRITDTNKPYLFLVSAALFLSPFANVSGFKDIFFICSGVSISFVLRKVQISSRLFLVIFLIGTVLFAAVFGNGLMNGFAYDIARSESSLESNFGFLFGLLAVYSLLKRDNWIFLLAVVGAFLTLKRIVLVAIFLCWIVNLLPESIRRKVLNPIFMLIANLLIILLIILYANHHFDFLITFVTGLSANHFGQGRQTLYASLSLNIIDNPFQHFFLGAGPGAAYETLDRLFGLVGEANLHSDLLKILYEYGVVVFSIFIWLAYRAKDVRVRVMFLFVNVLFATDNVLIYHFFLFFMCLLSISFENDDESTPQHC